MNKQIKYIAILCILALSACKKDTAIFDKSADERRIERMQAYRNQLIAGENGWILHVASSENGSTQQFWCKFIDKNNRVIVQDIKAYVSNEQTTSEFKIGTSQYVSLIFDTGSSLGKSSSVNTKDESAGSPFYRNNKDLIDFEFVFDKTQNDTISLLGVFSKSPAFMFKASATDKKKYFDDYYQFKRSLFGIAGEFGSPLKFSMDPFLRQFYASFNLPQPPDALYNYTLTLKSGTNKYVFVINPVKGSVMIADDLGGGAFEKPQYSGLYYTDAPSKGFRLISPIKLSNGLVIDRIADFKKMTIFGASPVKITAKINNTIDAEIVGETDPIGFYFNPFYTTNLHNTF